MYNILILISGLSWTIAYLSLINRGIKSKNCGMPIIPLCLNVAWEFLYTVDPFFLKKTHFALVEIFVQLLWLVLDIVILVIYCKYGNYGDKKINKKTINVTKYLIACFFIQLALYLHFNNGGESATISAYLQNTLMSFILFKYLNVFKFSDNLSFTMVYSKLFGTFFYVLIEIFYGKRDPVIIILGLLILILDVSMCNKLHVIARNNKVAYF